MATLRTYLLCFWRRSNKLLIFVCTLCSAYGLLLIYSTNVPKECITQPLACVGGLLLALYVSQLDYHLMCHRWFWVALPVLLLVCMTFTPLGFNAVGTDDTAWLGLPFGSPTPFITFQPSEFLKIVFILTFSHHLQNASAQLNRPLTLLLLCIHAALPITLVFLQGDDGTALVFLLITVVMLFSAGIHWGYCGGAVTAFALVSVWLWQTLDESKRGRFLALIHPDRYVDTYGWQQHRALISIGNGGLWGTGYKNGGTLSLFARNNDFIFTEAAEEFGLLGAIVLLGLLLSVILLLIFTALRASDALGRHLCFGLVGWIASQAVINIGMNLRLVPVIGITLPFFSAGGSAVLALYLGIGLALSVHFHSQTQQKSRMLPS